MVLLWCVCEDDKKQDNERTSRLRVGDRRGRAQREDELGLVVSLEGVPDDIQGLAALDGVVETRKGEADTMVCNATLTNKQKTPHINISPIPKKIRRAKPAC